jgi:hypothetical protein
VNYRYLIVEAGVRYWEDAEVNGVEDAEGDLIPFRSGGLWRPVIDLQEGRILNWPEGTTASIHYKVCDAGEYWLSPDGVEKLQQYRNFYVPDEFLCHGDDGYGDYIIMDVDSSGKIANWEPPHQDPDKWGGKPGED